MNVLTGATTQQYANGNLLQSGGDGIAILTITIGEILQDPHKRDMQAVADIATQCMDSDDFREGRRAFMEKASRAMPPP